jgi:O-acetylhomoserine (thiol)-lyase
MLFFAEHRALPLRMARHGENTRKVVAFLAAQPGVESVAIRTFQPSRLRTSQAAVTEGCSAVFSFNMKGDRAAGKRFIEALRIFSSCQCWRRKIAGDSSASTTHYRMDAAALQQRELRKGRFGFGVENADDLIDDLGRALRAATR